VEDIDLPAYAVIRDSARVNEVLSRWDEADITYKAIALSQLSEIAPTLKTQSLAAAYRVGDVSINSRMLYQKLVVDIQKSGATIFTGTTISFKNYREALLQFNDHEAIQLEALTYVYATGYSTKTIFQQQFNRDVSMRYWKSHLVIVPRLSKSAIFSIDRHEAAMMNHGDYSIVGLNEDAVLCDEPSTEVIPENVDALLSAIQRLFYTKEPLSHCAIACIKVDAASSNQFARSLNISVTEPIRNHICILPGKMTETPFLVDWVTRQIFDRFNRSSTIAYRPCDTVAFSPDIHNLN
jgi:glycerol-3-phosphate dehydrogenase